MYCKRICEHAGSIYQVGIKTWNVMFGIKLAYCVALFNWEHISFRPDFFLHYLITIQLQILRVPLYPVGTSVLEHVAAKDRRSRRVSNKP
jgi:hypothetical protein